MTQDVEFSWLLEGDAGAVQAWLAEWLTEHVSGWCGAYGLDWSASGVDAHIERHQLVEREWAEITAAAVDQDCFVRVAKIKQTPVGVVYAEKRMDRYLALKTGVLSWIYVEPAFRRRGIARDLLNEAHKWFVKEQLPVSEVFVTGSNRAAIAAYQGGGYRILDHRLLAVMREDERSVGR